MIFANQIFSINSVTVSYLIRYDSLLQNVTDITKCDSYFITKCDRSFLKNASGFLLQNATVITKCAIYYKLRQYNDKFLNTYEDILANKGFVSFQLPHNLNKTPIVFTFIAFL